MPLDIDRYAHVTSSLQRWDARVKIATLGLLVLSVALIKTLPMAASALMSAMILVYFANLPLAFVAQGIKWVTVFLIPFLIIMPLSYPGAATAHVLGMPFAWEGFRLALVIMLKAIAIVMIAYTMFGSSRFDVSMIALQRLKCPKAVVQMLLFTYRYVFVFLAEMQRMDTAMRSRGFVKRTERIYKAMLAKGYQGEFHTLLEFEAGGKDIWKAALVVVLALALLGIDTAGVFSVAEQGWY